MQSNYNQAWDPSTPPEILTLLSKDEDGDVRYEVADNPTTPSDTLVALSHDNHPWVRRNVATNSNTPYGIWIRSWGRVLP